MLVRVQGAALRTRTTWLLVIFCAGFLATNANAQSCNANNEKSADACTDIDVEKRQTAYAILRGDALEIGDAPLTQSVANAEQALDRSLSQCTSSPFEAGCRYEAFDYAVFQLDAWLRTAKQNIKAPQAEENIDSGASYPQDQLADLEQENPDQQNEVSGTDQSSQETFEQFEEPTTYLEPENQYKPQKNWADTLGKIFGFTLFVALPILGLFVLWRRRTSAKCPECRNRTKLENHYEVLSRETRFRNNRVEGRSVREPYTNEERLYRVKCNFCDHEFDYTLDISLD